MSEGTATPAEAAAGAGRRVQFIRLGAAAIVLMAALAAAALLSRAGGPAASAVTPSAGSATIVTDPGAWVLPRLGSGPQIRLTDFRGRPLVVNFFASWCDPCRHELPGFSAVSKELRGRVTFVGVNALETGDGQRFARGFGIDEWPLARDVGGQSNSGLHDALGGTGMPLTAFYDRSGKLIQVHSGQLSEQELRSQLQVIEGISP